MKVAPSIDISGGEAVKRVKGLPGTGLRLGNPVKLAEELIQRGAEMLHIVDIDGAYRGKPVNISVIEEILRLCKDRGVEVQVGGGIRTPQAAELIYSMGADRVILGSLVFKEPQVFAEVVDLLGPDHIVVAVDARGGKVVVHGWTSTLELTPLQAIEKALEAARFGHVLYTCVDVEGTMKGVDSKTVEEIHKAYPDLKVHYAGGIASVDDVARLAKAGAYAAILGMSLYTGKLSLEEAIQAAKSQN